MKKRMLSILFALVLMLQVPVFAEQGTVKKEDGVYDVPVYLKNFYEEKASMGNEALREIARVELKDGVATYTIYTSQIIFSNMQGGITDLFVYNSNNYNDIKKLNKHNDKNAKKAVMTNVDLGEMNIVGKEEKEVPFDTAISFTKKAPLLKEMYIAVWVDAMDALAGGGKGSGEQKAILQFDWTKAKKVEEKQMPVKQEPVSNDKQEVTALYCNQDITVNGKLIKGLEVYSINQHTYFKLRDIASLANDTNSTFSVTWNGQKNMISVKTGDAYAVVGTELTAGNGLDKKGIKSTSTIEINGKEVNLNAYTIEGQNYFEIRPLAAALSNMKVGWNNDTKTIELTM